MNEKKPLTLIIYGPTGVGKTELTRMIADQFPAEVINMDVGQFYTPLTIGTAKPDWKNEQVTHHLFDIIDTPSDYSVVAYRAACIALVENIWRQGKLPILVGGSGFYLRSLFFPPIMPGTDNDSCDIDAWEQLYSIDPIRAKQISASDTYRIKRALSIWKQTGIKPSECKPQAAMPFDAYIVFLSRDRQELYNRINARVNEMLQLGWVNEVDALRGTLWEQFIYAKRLIGYNELLALDSQSNESFEKIVKEIQQRTRHYAKRQYTFWRMLAKDFARIPAFSGAGDSKMISIDLTLIKHDLYIRQLCADLATVINRKKKDV